MPDDWTPWLDRYRSHLEIEGLAPRTVSGRLGLLERFVSWCRDLSLPAPRDVTLSLLSDYRRHRVQSVNSRGRRDCAFSVNTHLLALRGFFKFLASKGVTPAMLLDALGYVKQPRLLPKGTLVHRDVMRMLERIPGVTPIHLRDRAMLEVLYSSGIRRQELVDLTLTDIDLEGGVLRIESGKGGKGRIVPIGKAAREWVDRYLRSARSALLGRRDDPGSLFLSKSGRRLHGGTVKDVVQRWARAAGIEKPVSPHTLRRSCATGMIRNRAHPAHVKDLLGHADFTSLQSYVRLEIVDLKDAHRRFHPREREENADDAQPPMLDERTPET
ncbi:MAG: tyrosine-type recombinase/integrase [Planctomycetes bacterium]|nr:tyrosine-type recombinase/integrase [Planctomycetota bacterium]